MTDAGLFHNTPENMDQLYGSPNFLSGYLSTERIAWYGEVIRIFVDEANVDFSQKSIADVGCGTGHALKYIHENYDYGHLYGYDYSPVALEIARETLPTAKFVFHDLNEPIDEDFDVIIGLETFEHLYYPARVLKNVRDALRPDGLIFLTVPDGEVDGFIGHINRWNIQEWMDFSGAIAVGILKDILWGILEKEPKQHEHR